MCYCSSLGFRVAFLALYSTQLWLLHTLHKADLKVHNHYGLYACVYLQAKGSEESWGKKKQHSLIHLTETNFSLCWFPTGMHLCGAPAWWGLRNKHTAQRRLVRSSGKEGPKVHRSMSLSHPAELTPTTSISGTPNSVTKHLAPVSLFAQAKCSSFAWVAPTPHRAPRQIHICPEVESNIGNTIERERQPRGSGGGWHHLQETHQKQCGLQVESRKIWIQKGRKHPSGLRGWSVCPALAEDPSSGPGTQSVNLQLQHLTPLASSGRHLHSCAHSLTHTYLKIIKISLLKRYKIRV